MGLAAVFITVLKISVVNYAQLKICLRMVANGAFLRRAFVVRDVPAVAANPNGLFLLFENGPIFDIFKQLEVAFFMFFFNIAHHLKKSPYIFKAFLTRLGRHTFVHLRPLFVLTGRGGLKIEFKGPDGEAKACIWMRGSQTENVFRVMADTEGPDPSLERALIKWQRQMVLEADSMVV